MSLDYRACPTLRMLFRPSLAFRVQVWLIARVAMNRMHQYKQESKCIISRRSNFTCREVITVIKLHMYAGEWPKWMTSIKVVGHNVTNTSHLLEIRNDILKSLTLGVLFTTR